MSCYTIEIIHFNCLDQLGIKLIISYLRVLTILDLANPIRTFRNHHWLRTGRVRVLEARAATLQCATSYTSSLCPSIGSSYTMYRCARQSTLRWSAPSCWSTLTDSSRSLLYIHSWRRLIRLKWVFTCAVKI